MIALGITTVFAIIQSCSFGDSPSATVDSLIVFRFFLGLGIGGGYPLSSTIMAEYANTSNRGTLVAAVFAMQGVGIMLAALVTIVVSLIFQSAYPSTSGLFVYPLSYTDNSYHNAY